MVDFFLEYLKAEKRLSPHTLIAYRTDLQQFQDFYSPDLTLKIENAQPQDIREWVVQLSEKKNDPRSINRKIASLRSFYKYLLKKKILFQDPCSIIKSLKTGKKLPVYLEESATEDLFEVLDFDQNWYGLRDRLILELLYGTGIRLAELIGIQQKDIDLYGKKITVLGKRNKSRIIPLNDGLVSFIKKYLEVSEAEGIDNQSFVLMTDKYDKMYPVFVQRKVKHYLGLVATLTKKSPHVLRHTFATHLLNRGADLNAIKELLGHANLAATQIYTHNTITELMNVYKKSHPKA